MQVCCCCGCLLACDEMKCKGRLLRKAAVVESRKKRKRKRGG